MSEKKKTEQTPILKIEHMNITFTQYDRPSFRSSGIWMWKSMRERWWRLSVPAVPEKVCWLMA